MGTSIEKFVAFTNKVIRGLKSKFYSIKFLISFLIVMNKQNFASLREIIDTSKGVQLKIIILQFYCNLAINFMFNK